MNVATVISDPDPIPNGPPAITTPEPGDLADDDPDELTFTGMWIASVDSSVYTTSFPSFSGVTNIAPPVELEGADRVAQIATVASEGEVCGSTAVDAQFPTGDVTCCCSPDHETWFDCLDPEGVGYLDEDWYTIGYQSAEYLLAVDVYEDLRQHRDIFEDAVADVPVAFHWKGNDFFDPEAILDPLAHHRLMAKKFDSPLPASIQPFASKMWLLLFWLVPMFWDTVSYILIGDGTNYVPSMPRKMRRMVTRDRTRKSLSRGRNLRSLFFFPAAWMVMSSSAIMMNKHSFHGCTPSFPIPSVAASLVFIQEHSVSTLLTIQGIEAGVDLSIGNWVRYNTIKARRLSQEIQVLYAARSIEDKATSSVTLEREINSTMANEGDYFDSYEQTPEVIENFFDAECTFADKPSFVEYDPFDFQGMCNDRSIIDSVFQSPEEELADLVAHPSRSLPTPWLGSCCYHWTDPSDRPFFVRLQCLYGLLFDEPSSSHL